jgi:hypothetical protein
MKFSGVDSGVNRYSTICASQHGQQEGHSSRKCLFGLALRQALGFVHSLLRLAGLQWPVPDYSTLSRRQQTLKVQLPYRPRTTALDLLVDSTGIKFLGEGEWKRKKHGAEYRRQWRKVHLGIDAQTLEIRSIEVTDNSVGDAPVLPHLLAQIPPDEKLARLAPSPSLF